MQYFVSIENTAYHLWQAELLVESFKYHKLEDDLLVVIADNQTPTYTAYKNNLINHKNKFVVPNFGKAFNKIRSVMWALEEGHLKKPFVLLHPDMVLQKPIPQKNNSIVFNQENNQALKKKLAGYLKKCLIAQESEWFLWMPLGSTLIFNDDVPDIFFTHVCEEIYPLMKEFGQDCNLESFAWVTAIYKHILFKNKFKLTVCADNLEQTMIDHNTTNNIIHYKHGIPPAFSKHHFRYESPIMLNTQSPFECIIENNVTSSTNFVCNLITHYLA